MLLHSHYRPKSLQQLIQSQKVLPQSLVTDHRELVLLQPDLTHQLSHKGKGCPYVTVPRAAVHYFSLGF